MIEAVMYMAIGFLAGCLVGLTVIPLVHNRAVRLTVRRLEGLLPQSIDEIRAQKDLLRAEFAVAARRLELHVEKFREKCAKLLVQVEKKNELAKRLAAERDAMKAEAMDLRTRVVELDRQLADSAADQRPNQRPKGRVRVVRQMVPRRLVS